MNLRWLIFDHVPAGVELTPEQRRELGRRTKVLRRTKPFLGPVTLTVVASLAGSAVASSLFGYGLHYLIRHRPGNGAYVLAHLGLTLGYMLSLQIIIAWVISRFSAPYVRVALNEMNIPVCNGCGYNLAHLGESLTRCPECGVAITPRSDRKEASSHA